MKTVSDAWRIAIFDFTHAARTKKAWVLLIFYLMGALGATALFVKTVKAIEDAMADALLVAKTEKAGSMTSTLFESQQFKEIVVQLVGDRRLALSLFEIPPLALFYGSLGLVLIPLVAVLSSCDAVSSEVSSGSCRYVLLRSSRSSFALGKLASQAVQMLVGIGLGAVVCELYGAYAMTEIAWLDTSVWLIRMSFRVWIYGLAYLGVGLGASLAVRSVGGSRAVALLVLVAIGIAGSIASSNWALQRAPVVAPTLHALLPSAHRMDLWQPDFTARLAAIAMLIALGTLYFSAGFSVFRRRDA